MCRQGGFLVALKLPFWPEKWAGHTTHCAIIRGTGAHKVHNHGTRVGDTNGAPGFTSICSSLVEPGLAREGVARQAISAAPRILLASVYAI